MPTLTPEEIALIISLLQSAVTEGKALYDAYQIKAMADLQAKLADQLNTSAQDRQTANADIDARDKALESDLSK